MHLAAPRSDEGGGAGLVATIYMMSIVLVFAIWALGVAVQCQERSGLLVALSRYLPWTAMMVELHEMIMEEW